MGLTSFVKQGDYDLDIEGIRESNKKDSFRVVKPSDIKKELIDNFRNGKPLGYSSGLSVLDPIFRWRRKGGLYLLSAYPQAGKSELMKYMCVLNAHKGIKSVIFSPEEETEDFHEDLVRTYLGKNINPTFKNQCTEAEYNRGLDWVEENFNILEYDGMVDFANLIAEYDKHARLDASNKMFVTDPWNYVAEGSFDDRGDKYLKIALSHMKTFSKRHEIHNVIVEHQNKPRLTAKGEVPKASVHNVTGGAMWYKKCDSIILLHNYWEEHNQDITVDFETAKSKGQRYNGQRGTRSLYFDLSTGRYLEHDPRQQTGQSKINYSEPSKKDEDLPF